MFLAFIARLSTDCQAVDDQSFTTAFKTIIPKARLDNALENAIRTGFVEAAKQDKHPRFLDKLCTDLRNIVGSAIFDHQFESELVCAFDNLQFDTASDFPFRLQCKIISHITETNTNSVEALYRQYMRFQAGDRRF